MRNKITLEDVAKDQDYILCLTLKNGEIKWVGEGMKFRINPLHPRGWRKEKTARGYADQIAQHPANFWSGQIAQVQVCKRFTEFACLSSYAISKQNSDVAKGQDHVTD